MAVYSIKSVQRLATKHQSAWVFFSTPENLRLITPESYGMKVISKHHGERVYPGQIIEYRLKPLLGIGIYWMTEITHVQPGSYFADEQRYGPYKMWHHQHHFHEIEEGVIEMTYIIQYKDPGWIFGGLINALLVRPKLKQLFQFRYQKIEELFGKFDDQPCEIIFS